MADEKFLNDDSLATLWSIFKEYINEHTATTDGMLKIELSEDVFGQPPWILEFTPEDDEEQNENRTKIETMPTQKDVPTYNGSEIVPEWSDYNPTELAISGDTRATNAGNYTAIFTPTDNYCWDDDTIAGKEVEWSIKKATLEVPSQQGILTYNGELLKPTWSNDSIKFCDVEGTQESIDAGSFVLTLTPKSNFTWADGTETPQQVTWTIGKATPMFKLSTYTVKLTADNPTVRVTWETDSDGKVGISIGTGAWETGISEKYIQLTAISTGSGVVPVSLSETNNYLGATAEIEVNVDMNILPSNYKEVEYLESSGTQVIDTSIKPTQNMKIEVDFGIPTDASFGEIFGSDYIIPQKAAGVRGIVIKGSSYSYSGVCYGATSTKDFTKDNGKVAIYSNIIYHLVVDLENREATLSDTTIEASYKLALDDTPGYTFNDKNHTIALFANHMEAALYYNGGNVRIYNWSIYDDEVPVQNLIPCLDENNEPCMYDTVTKTTFKNVGKGIFLTGSIKGDGNA